MDQPGRGKARSPRRTTAVVGIGPRRRRNKYSLFTLIERSFWNSPGYWIALNPHMTRAAHWLGVDRDPPLQLERMS